MGRATIAALEKEIREHTESNQSRPVNTFRSILAILASVLCLSGCFDFNKTFTPPTATFQIVISSTNYGGTYVWASQDNAYEAAAAADNMM
jgi:uncharacterized lipoprotein YajG